MNQQTCSAHTWACPVLMKLDPNTIAWTCSTCGAIHSTPVGASAPPASALTPA